MSPRPPARAWCRAAPLIVLVAFVGFLFGAATPAGAHADLVSSEPAAGEHLSAAPREVTLRFTESVTVVPAGFRLIDAEGATVPLGSVEAVAGQVRVPIPAALADGAYLLTYRVVSTDSHPVGGALDFSVGAAPTRTPGFATALPPPSDQGVAVVAGVIRWVSFAGVILLLGVPIFVALCWPAGAREPRVALLTVSGGVLLLGAAAAQLPLQTARLRGGGLTDGFDRSGLQTVLDSPYGEAMLARIVLVVVLLGALWLGVTRCSTRALGLAIGCAAGLLLTFARSGHAAAGTNTVTETLADMAHLGAAATWIGGLVVIAAVLLPRHQRAGNATSAPGVLVRWSAVAVGAVLVLVLAGSVRAWQELGSIEELVDSEYGRWLLVKAGLTAGVLGLAEVGRRRVVAVRRRLAQGAGAVPATAAGTPARVPDFSASLGAARADSAGAALPGADRERLRRSVGAELLLSAGVLAVTAVLVSTAPNAGGAAQAAQVLASEQRASLLLPHDVEVEVVADPARAGAARLTILTRSLGGEAIDPEEIMITAALPEAGIAPITLTPTQVSVGRYRVDGRGLLLAGTWTLRVTVRTSETDAGVGSLDIVLT